MTSSASIKAKRAAGRSGKTRTGVAATLGALDPGYGLTLSTDAGERFQALSTSERDHVLDGFQDYMRRALNGLTMEEYLAERRREAAHDA